MKILNTLVYNRYYEGTKMKLIFNERLSGLSGIRLFNHINTKTSRILSIIINSI
jgi:hypothetical protein